MVTATAPASRLPGGGRFVALDSLRGVAACMVVLYHLHGQGYLLGSALVRGGYLWVDFFFVLSGFVIAAAYADRLAAGHSLRRFAILRLGRVWPLHLAMVALTLAIELAMQRLGTGGLVERAAFAGNKEPAALLESVLLLQVWSDRWFNGWNPPGWSISGEVLAYAVAALLWRWTGRWAGRWAGYWAVAGFAVLALGAAAAALSPLFDVPRGFFISRTVLGFSLGVLAWELHRRGAARILGGARWLTAGEVAAAALMLGAVALHRTVPLPLADLIFAAAVLVFAQDGGALSRLLARRWPVLIGTLSYSIYMVHMQATGRGLNLLTLAQRHGDLPGLTIEPSTRTLLGDPLAIDLAALALLAITVTLAWPCWRLIEAPAREWSRKLRN